jgi:polar amino acid transport system permease protein
MKKEIEPIIEIKSLSKFFGVSTGQTYRYFVLPQSVHFILPPMTGEVTPLVKSSTLVNVIVLAELTTFGRIIISDTYMRSEIWFTVAMMCMALTLILSFGVSNLQRRYAVDH